ncbi:MAG: DNA mismatch repair protein MutS [Deltaproteobacteria bacterium]|nr:DNA mismatch repair protein MutS [Deltaproteobacteria bacterium]
MNEPSQIAGSEGPTEAYVKRQERFAAVVQALEASSKRFSVARFVVFGAGAICLLMILLRAGAPNLLWYLAAVLCFGVFVALVVAHDGVLRRRDQGERFRLLNHRALQRLERRWEQVPVPSLPPSEPPCPYARDLGLFGRASLAHLLGGASSPPGRKRLGQWLSSEASADEIGARQESVRELAPLLELRQALEVAGWEMGQEKQDPELFFRWAEGPVWLRKRTGLRWLARGLTAASLLLLVVVSLGKLPIQALLLLWLINLLVGYGAARWIHPIFAQASAREGQFAAYGAIFEILEGRRFESPRLKELVETLEATGLSVHQEMKRLHRLVEASDTRLSSFHFVPQGILLWDFHVLEKIEKWQLRAGNHIRHWLRVLGDVEALGALGGLAFDNPDWTFPEIVSQEGTTVVAKDLGHPLLSSTQRVTNDVEVGPSGSFLLVTGSNMSGKSTLLRSLGVNIVLAQAGGPVCASFFQLPPLRLATSIQVEDSLEEGTSFFMAELKRLKMVVDSADDLEGSQERRLFYLLDEVLRGTNSRERQIAVQKVLSHLLAKGAIGAVSTHDLELANLPGLDQAAQPIHFRETVHAPDSEGAVMTFDYKARPGVATTTNALRLLALVGLDET